MINIRNVKLEDSEKLVEIYKYYVEKTAITFDYEVPTVEEFRKKIEKTKESFPYLVIEENDEIVGYAYASKFHERIAYQWTVEISIYLAHNSKAKGFGRKLYLELEKILKKQEVKTITACITFPGEGSVQFHEKLGFKKVAHFEKVGYKLKQWHDVVWYQKEIASYDDNPNDIKKVKL